MATVRWHTTMSLDGFVAGPDDAMDWVFESAGPNPVVDAVIAATGAIVAGRRSYEVGRRSAPGAPTAEPFGGGWSGRQLVVTHEPPEDETDPSVAFVGGEMREVIATASAAAEGRDVLLIGADVARQAVERDLVDELIVHVAPLLLGDGLRLYGSPGMPRIDLDPLEVSTAGTVTNLRYRVVKRAAPG